MIKDLKDFFKKLDTEPDFKNKLKKSLELYPESDVLWNYSLDEKIMFIYEVIIPFAKEHGFEISVEDILSEDSEKIEDEYLEKIAGGVNLSKKLSAGTLAAIQALIMTAPTKEISAKSLSGTDVYPANISKTIKPEKESSEYCSVVEALEKNHKTMHQISEDYPLNEVDGMIFATLVYLPMNCVPNLDSELSEKEITVSEWAKKTLEYLNSKDKKNGSAKLSLHSEDNHNIKNYILDDSSKKNHDSMQYNRIKLLSIVAECPRYMNIKIGNFRGKYIDASNKDYEQFAAATFTLENGTKIVSFRGTDSTLSGWREDLDLSWSKQVPAQRDALKYLEEIYNLNPDSDYIITGHSKGGHLAVYSSLYTCLKNRKFFDRIKNILNYDGPGIRSDILSDIDSNLFNEVNNKLITFIPQFSVIGRIMNDTSKGKFVCIYSSSKNFFYQHDSLTWHVNKDYEQSETKFKSYEIQPESEFSAGAISIFLDAIDKENSMRIFLNWIFNFMDRNNIEIDDKRSKSEIFKAVFYNYFIKGKSLSEIIDIIFAPKTVIDISEEEQKSFKDVMKAVFKGITLSYWNKHMELNKKLGFSPELNESIEKMIKDEYSIESIANVVKVVNEKALTLENIWKFIKKLYS